MPGIGDRVRVVGADGETYEGPFAGRAVGRVWVGQTEVLGTDLVVEDARLTGTCGHVANLLFDGLCAPCYRTEARKRDFEGTPCDECGRKGAFRDPLPRKNVYLCAECHGKSGYLPMSRQIQRAVATREGSQPLGVRERPVCEIKGMVGVRDCRGTVKPRTIAGASHTLCDEHSSGGKR